MRIKQSVECFLTHKCVSLTTTSGRALEVTVELVVLLGALSDLVTHVVWVDTHLRSVTPVVTWKSRIKKRFGGAPQN